MSRIWTPEVGVPTGYPDGARARDWLRHERTRERDKWKRIHDPRVNPFAPARYQLVSLVINAAGTITTSSATCTNSITALTAGSCVCVCAQGSGTDTVTSVSDDAGNVYTQDANSVATDSGGTARFCNNWYCLNVLGGATTVTVTYNSGSATTNRKIVKTYEIKGLVGGGALDTGNHLNNGTATTVQSGPAVTTVNPVEVLIAHMRTAGSVDTENDGNFTLDEVLPGSGGASHFITASANTYTPSWHSPAPGTYASSISAFKDGTAAAAVVEGPRGSHRPIPFGPGGPMNPGGRF